MNTDYYSVHATRVIPEGKTEDFDFNYEEHIINDSINNIVLENGVAVVFFQKQVDSILKCLGSDNCDVEKFDGYYFVRGKYGHKPWFEVCQMCS
jgi:hypothetical protein